MIGNILLMDQCDQLFDVQKSPNYQLKRNNTFFLCGFNNTRTLLFFTVQLTHTAQLLWLVSSQTDAVSTCDPPFQVMALSVDMNWVIFPTQIV